MAKVTWLDQWRKGGPGSGPHPGHGTASPVKPSGKPSRSANDIQKPGYNEQASSRNPGMARAGGRPQDIYPERYNADGTHKGVKHWLGAWLRGGKS